MKFYGKNLKSYVDRIYQANRPMLSSPHRIYVGQKLVIPNIDDKLQDADILREAKDVKIHVAPGKYSPYYHIRFTLTPDIIKLQVPISERMPRYTKSNEYVFTKGGQFEVFIDKDAFPINSPHFEKKYLILRMPWTSTDFEDSQLYIAEKHRLFQAIYEMKKDNKGAIEVTLELNPFVNVLSKKPLKVELAGRNIFFRQAHGRYIDYVGPIRED
jgi:hypothetical protein